MVVARILLLAGVLALPACGDDDDGSFAGPTFVTNLAIQDVNGANKQRFAPGETVYFELSVRNRRNTTVEVIHQGTCFPDELMVAPARTVTPLWNSGRGIACIAVPPQPLIFQPLETKIYRRQWDQRDDSGQPVPVGDYEVFGTLGERQFPGQPGSRNSELSSQLQLFDIR